MAENRIMMSLDDLVGWIKTGLQNKRWEAVFGLVQDYRKAVDPDYKEEKEAKGWNGPMQYVVVVDEHSDPPPTVLGAYETQDLAKQAALDWWKDTFGGFLTTPAVEWVWEPVLQDTRAHELGIGKWIMAELLDGDIHVIIQEVPNYARTK